MTPTSSSSPASVPEPVDGSKSRVFIALVVAVAVVGGLVGTAIYATRAATQMLVAELKLARADTVELITIVKRGNLDLLDAVVSLENVMQPPSNDKIFSNLGRGIGVTENAVRTGSVGTTPQSAFVTDLTTAQQSDAYTQEIIIRNRDDATTPTQNLCFFPLPWATAGATCQLKCAGAVATNTCPAPGGAGASTDGSMVPAGSASHRRYDGTSCLCIVASAAGTDYQTERVVR